MKASRAQLSALLALWPRYLDAGFLLTVQARAELSPGQLCLFLSSDREQRHEWASRVLGRVVLTFTDLTSDEAARLIDTMKRALGQPIRPARKRPDRDQAQAYGTAGRRDSSTKEIRLVDDATLDLIDGLVAQLGWDHARFESFLHSTSSPVRSGAIRTLAEGNRVIWALRGMIRRKERSNERRRAR